MMSSKLELARDSNHITTQSSVLELQVPGNQSTLKEVEAPPQQSKGKAAANLQEFPLQASTTVHGSVSIFNHHDHVSTNNSQMLIKNLP